MTETNSEPNDPLGRSSPWEQRKPGLPSDCECRACDGVIKHDEQCFKLHRSYNAHGEVESLASDDGIIICAECGRELLNE